ncbi:HalOD1 output domain-containing protein [Natrialbaceae archaeon AArc-T1-2]|uniref:HalOD1 output domain-containing protein n=1 Tax=Natrialbaceae archaeon AArc-T1-2 TaxID=3053904 RepID=UPI00255A85B7|nr:HalOD1 output domain-containing protein [Natrialbaceae archaeon AArc-T1-2]WIV66252.1 hypothetical protein QQ977_11180 [Natrialbaceae archaeon AArc-T1-2]
MAQTESVSVQVVRKVADCEGVDPAALQPPLQTVIDTDALDSLFRLGDETTHADGVVEFTYKGYPVTVDSTGRVDVAQPRASNDCTSGETTE